MERTKNIFRHEDKVQIINKALMLGMELKYPVMEQIVWTVKMVEVSIDKSGLKEGTCRMLMHKMIETNTDNDEKKERWLPVRENMTYDMFLDWCNNFTDEQMNIIAGETVLNDTNRRNE